MYCCRSRSTSSAVKVGRRTTSASIAIAGPTFVDITPTFAVDASHRAEVSSVPPSDSISSAIRVASRVAVPLVRRFAVMSASPANSGGSTSPPFLIRSTAEINGVFERGMTTTLSPFGRTLSAGFGKATDRGAAGGGGVACGDLSDDRRHGTKKGSKKNYVEKASHSSFPPFAILAFCQHLCWQLSSKLPAGSTTPCDCYP